jgi:PAS domain S-box-containing protein
MLKPEDYFTSFYTHAKANGIVIIDKDAMIQEVNEAFTNAFGYTTEDLKSKPFKLLFTENDQALLKPEIELNTTLRSDASSDENYLVHKNGTPIWITGEVVMVKNETEIGFMKIIHNIHAQKQLERYLLASDKLLYDLFNSTTTALLLLDGQLRTEKANAAFLNLFDCSAAFAEGEKIGTIPHPFWSDQEIKNDVRRTITNSVRLDKEYIMQKNNGTFRKLHIVSKTLISGENAEKKLLLVIKEM